MGVVEPPPQVIPPSGAGASGDNHALRASGRATRPRTRSRELMRLGVPRRQAIRHGKSRKGYWHMAKTIASGVGMTNQWLEDQGLIRLKQLWSELAPLR